MELQPAFSQMLTSEKTCINCLFKAAENRLYPCIPSPRSKERKDLPFRAISVLIGWFYYKHLLPTVHL